MSTLSDVMSFKCKINLKWRKKFCTFYDNSFTTTVFWQKHFQEWAFLKGEYLDIYEGIQSEILNTTRFDENSDLSTTHLGRVETTRTSKIKVEETFQISEQGYTVRKLLDGSECQILLNVEASKSFMSKSHYLHCKSLHSLPIFLSKTERIQVINGQ